MTINDNSFSRKLLVGFCCWGVLQIAVPAHGAEISAQFNAGYGASDNIARTSTNEIDETMLVAGMDLGLAEDTARLTVDIRTQLEYLKYMDGTFDNELIGGLIGNASFNIIDERLSWIVQDTFGQQVFNPLAPASPGNREDVNFFTTGPTLRLFSVSRNFAEIGLRYSSVNFEVQDNDNQRMSATLSLGREVRRGATLSLNATTQRVEFDTAGLSRDFDRHDGFVRYEHDTGRNIISTDIGVTTVEFNGQTGDGTLARINWTRIVSQNATVTLSGGTQYSDQGDIFRVDSDFSDDLRDTNDVPVSPAPFRNNFANIAYSLNSDRTAVVVRFGWEEDDFEGSAPNDRDVISASFSLRRDFSRKAFGGLNFRYVQRDFSDLSRVDNNTTLSADLGFRFTPAVSASLQFLTMERSGDSLVEDINENRIFVRFTYSPAWGR